MLPDTPPKVKDGVGMASSRVKWLLNCATRNSLDVKTFSHKGIYNVHFDQPPLDAPSPTYIAAAETSPGPKFS